MEAQSDYLADGIKNETKANKQLKGSFFYNLGVYKNERKRGAVKYFIEAANSYRLAEEWAKAAEMYHTLSVLYNDSFSLTLFQYRNDALTCYKKLGFDQYFPYAKETIKKLLEDKQIYKAADLSEKLAEECKNCGKLSDGARHFEEAAKLYDIADLGNAQLKTGSTKAADLTILQNNPDFTKAITLYEKGIANHIEPLYINNARNLLIKVCLCCLALDDTIKFQKKIASFGIRDPSFSNLRTYTVLTNLCGTKEKKDMKGYEKSGNEFSTIYQMDEAGTKILGYTKEFFDPSKTKKYIYVDIDS